MRPVRLVAACLLAAGAATGCSGNADRPAATPTTTATTTAPGPTGTTGPGTATTAAERWTTAPKAGSGNPEFPERTPMLVAVRTGSHDGYDRLVLQFRNGLPNWRVNYVNQVASESGETVPLEGAAFLYVDTHPATGHQDTAPFKQTYTGPHTLTPHHPMLRQVAWVDDFEGHVGFGLGLQRRTGFRVLELREPARLAIDVAH
ncbi:MAG TPA: hypothetical protein VGR74_12610 [Actinomycetota bacterium]|nr:hypothetical protein [Actinomycetota bacterium]